MTINIIFSYQLIIIQKRTLGKGSAIFIHLTSNFMGTSGCIALNKKDFLILIRLINRKTKIFI